MQYICPRTHFDFVLDDHPDFSKATAALFSRLPDSAFAYSQIDIDIDAFERLAMNEMVKSARAVTKDMPGYSSSMSDGEIMSRLAPEMGELLMGALHLEHLCTGNFERFGRRTYFMGRELTERFAKTSPNIPAYHLEMSVPCVLLVYDTQLMRNAVTSVIGAPSIDEGVVSVYVMQHMVGEDRFLAIFGFITNRRGIAGQCQRIIQLGDGNVSVATAMQASLAEDPAFPFKGDQSSPKATLARVVANTLLYLNSRNADITPGIHTDLSKASPKERRRLEKAFTPLEYSLVGGWLSGDASNAPTWKTTPDGDIELA